MCVEPLHGVTFAVMWSAATRQAHAIAPPGLGTTMQGLLGGMHFGLGSALGALIGGSIYQVLYLFLQDAHTGDDGCPCLALRLQDHISSVGRCSRPQFGTVVDG
eukprot:m.57958 g.57958  ORF g.57958 m.57958 type:complete len:104 (-) comp13753_c0_seq13:758-1069(-)